MIITCVKDSVDVVAHVARPLDILGDYVVVDAISVANHVVIYVLELDHRLKEFPIDF